MHKEILAKVDDIIATIENSPEYQKYLSLKKQMAKNKDLMALIKEVKVLQKDVIHHMDKKALLRQKMDELNDDPLYREYQNTIDEINNTYNIIETSLNNYFEHKFN